MRLTTLTKRLDVRRRAEQAESGQSLVEMTVGFVILIVMVSGLIDLGRAYFTFVALEDAAGEGALYMSLSPSCPDATGDPDCVDPKNAYHRMTTAGGANANSIVNWQSGVDLEFVCTPAGGSPGAPVIADLTNPSSTYDPTTSFVGTACDGLAVGDQVEVSITYYFELLSPVIPDIAGSDTLPLTARAAQNVIGE